MAKHLAKTGWGALGLVLGILMTTTTGHAQAPFTATQGAEKVGKVKKAKAPKLPKDKNVGENTAQRDKRLLRECRGRPNAGACEGYAN